MASMLRRLKRASKKATKFKFTAALQELVLVVDDANTWKPERIVVCFMHRRRKISYNDRNWESSFSKPEMSVLIWPEQIPEVIDIVTTLYKGTTEDQFDDKEWTIVIEELTAKGKRKPIAAVGINMRLFILESPEHKSQLKLKLRPLVPSLAQCSLTLLLSSDVLKEGFSDNASLASSCASLNRTSREQSLQNLATSPKDEKAKQDIGELAGSIQKWSTSEKPSSIGSPIKEVPITYRDSAKVKVADVVDAPPKDTSPLSSGSPVARPPWRVPSEDRDSRLSTTISAGSGNAAPARISTEAYFEVDEKSRPVAATPPSTLPVQTIPVPSPRTIRAHSPRAPSRDRAPSARSGESLLAWTQRVTQGYQGVKITDFTKSWRSGLALCAILHAYRSDLLGEFDDLDFSETFNGRKNNVKKALAVSATMGVSDVPDENDILTPDSRVIKLLLERLRRIFEGTADLPTPMSISDHRISQMYNISDSEMKVVEEIKRKKEEREADPADERRMVNNGALTDLTVTSEDEVDGALERDLAFNREQNVSIKLVTPLPNLRASGRKSPTKMEELRKKARHMLENPTAALTSTTPDDERRRREARRLLDEASTDGAVRASSTNLNRSSTSRSRSSLTSSNTDLRKIELVRPAVQIHTFRKRDPSPVLVRKAYDEDDQPKLPAMGRQTQILTDKLKSRLDDGSSSTTFDRVKRFGSMRSQELRESIATFARQYGMDNALSGSQTSINATPTRKVASKWEKDVDDVERTAAEQARIQQELSDVVQQSEAIQKTIRETEQGSSEEETLFSTLMDLTNKKNSLVGRQEYYNIIENIREVSKQIAKYNAELDSLTKNTNEDFYRTNAEKDRTDKVMEAYMDAIQEKDSLIRKLFETEEEMHSDEERIKSLTLQRTTNFIRGNEQPLSASKRIMTWLKM